MLCEEALRIVIRSCIVLSMKVLEQKVVTWCGSFVGYYIYIMYKMNVYHWVN